MPMRLFLTLAFLAYGCAGVAPASAADEGTIRQRLKERWQQRQQEKAQAAAADNGTGTIANAGDYSFTLRHDGLTRMYRIHVPAQYNPALPAPVLFAFHGGGGSMDYQADDSRYGLIGKSEQAGFIAVFPNGYSKLASGKFATWNAGNCCGGARDEHIDDVDFIRRIVARLARQLNIDRQRIYATGMSNGAMMAYRLACDMPEVFRAIAAVAGTDNTSGCNPESPVAVLHIHAKNDDHVLFEGGAGPGVPKPGAVTAFTSVAATVDKWVKRNACGTPPRRVLTKPGAYCDLYAPCEGNTEVQVCVTEEGAHSWPGGHKTRGPAPSQAISANDVMWDFFTRQSQRGAGVILPARQ